MPEMTCKVKVSACKLRHACIQVTQVHIVSVHAFKAGRDERCACFAVCQPGGVPVHGCDWEWLGVGCHSVLGVLHVKGHACAVQLMGRGGLLASSAGAPCNRLLSQGKVGVDQHPHWSPQMTSLAVFQGG